MNKLKSLQKWIALLILAICLLAFAASFRPGTAGQAQSLSPAPVRGPTIPYSGQLTGLDGSPAADGAYTFRFALYPDQAGGKLLWSETQVGVILQSGAFQTSLGQVQPLPAEALEQESLWLEIEVRGPRDAGFTALAPRLPLSTAIAAPSQAAACAHDHVGETWTTSSTSKALMITNSTGSLTDVGLFGVASPGGWSYFGQAGIAGYSEAGPGVSAISSNGSGISAQSTNGRAIEALGTGKIYSVADSELYLSPHSLVAREDDPSVLLISPQTGGGVRIRNLGATGAHYVSLPISTFGKLYGSQLYVKSLMICFKTVGAGNQISAIAVAKSNGTDGGETYYMLFVYPFSSDTRTCNVTNATGQREPIDHSSWVQLNLNFSGTGPGNEIYLYEAVLTLSELASPGAAQSTTESQLVTP